MPGSGSCTNNRFAHSSQSSPTNASTFAHKKFSQPTIYSPKTQQTFMANSSKGGPSYISPKNSQQQKHNVSQFSGGTNLLGDIDFKSNQIKDFNKAYKILASKIIEKGASSSKDALKPQSNLLITEKDLTHYSKKNDAHIHERLYKEKDKYFERKNFVSTHRQEEELKLCTFQPNKDKLDLSATSKEVLS